MALNRCVFLRICIIYRACGVPGITFLNYGD